MDYPISLDVLARLSPEQCRILLRSVALSSTPEYRPVSVALTDDPERNRILRDWELRSLFNAHSIIFMTEILPILRKYMNTLVPFQRYRLLDVGARTGAGSELLAYMHQGPGSYIPLDVDTIDIEETFINYQLRTMTHIKNVIRGDIFELPSASYDLIVCSHTIEHLEDPVGFCEQLTRIARKYVFIYCPFNEDDPIPGHRLIDQPIVSALNPIEQQIVHSWCWRGKENKGAECILFVLRGNEAAD